MKRHHSGMAVSVRTGREAVALGSAAKRIRTASTEDTKQPASSLPGATHTLVLTGELDRASAPMLEAEIERLCEAGIRGLTLDLSQLTYIDTTGVAVITFRSGLCKRRGVEFALIAGSGLVQRAFELAGVIDRLPFQQDPLSATSHDRRITLGAR